MVLKGEMSMLNVLHLQEIDMKTLRLALQKKRDEAPQFFSQSPVVIDCSELAERCEAIDFSELKDTISEQDFIPVGIRGIPEHLKAKVTKAGWALMRSGHVPASASTESTAATAATAESSEEIETISREAVQEKSSKAALENKPKQQSTESIPAIKSVTIDRPVRSGQQVYAANADLTLLSATSSGSELMADGSIHAYGPMRGRVLAGAHGNESARIFCSSLQAELIAIAGRYLLLDESNTKLKGRPAMVRLEGEKLLIEPLG